jgi:hypothetical protein
MNRLRTALARRRKLRARLREDRAIRRLIAAAPTRESAHELATLALRRR